MSSSHDITLNSGTGSDHASEKFRVPEMDISGRTVEDPNADLNTFLEA